MVAVTEDDRRNIVHDGDGLTAIGGVTATIRDEPIARDDGRAISRDVGDGGVDDNCRRDCAAIIKCCRRREVPSRAAVDGDVGRADNVRRQRVNDLQALCADQRNVGAAIRRRPRQIVIAEAYGGEIGDDADEVERDVRAAASIERGREIAEPVRAGAALDLFERHAVDDGRVGVGDIHDLRAVSDVGATIFRHPSERKDFITRHSTVSDNADKRNDGRRDAARIERCGWHRNPTTASRSVAALNNLIAVADDHGRRGVHDVDDLRAVGGVAVAIGKVPVNEHGFKTLVHHIGEDALDHDEWWS